MAESASPNAPNGTLDISAEASYTSLVRNIMWNLDMNRQIAERHNGGSPALQGQIEAYEGLLRWLCGFEGTDLDGLRARFEEQS